MQSIKLPDPMDTIVALASARGGAARAIVRMSGRNAATIVTSLCPEFEKDQARPSCLIRDKLCLPDFHAPISVDVYWFPAPRTYTGQDVVELHLISSLPIVDAVIAQCLNAGARAAEPGEFTMRAFLAGKLDLTRAEAVLGVIEAADQNDLRHALKQLAGGIAQPLCALRDDLLDLLADIEAGLDFADEDIRFVQSNELFKRLGNALAQLTLLKRQLQQRAQGQRPFRAVLAGPPNAGKSSLFNALIGKDAALVSSEPGTTRDYLEAVLDVDGATIALVDTAGVGVAADNIDTTAQRLGKEQSTDADLVLWCTPSDAVETDFPSTPRTLHIATKADRALGRTDLLATSAHTGTGLAELRQRLADEVRRAGHAALATSLSRCSHHVNECIQHLQHAHSMAIHEDQPELLALETRLAIDELGAMVGAVYTDDLLGRIFSRFCIGK